MVSALNSEPENLNPLSALSESAHQVISLIFLQLAVPDSDLLHYRPALASHWDTLSDGKVIRFHLRRNVFWHDGIPVTARDVAFTYRLQTDPAYTWDGYHFKQNILRVVVLNDSTIDFYFKQKNLSMLTDAVEGEILPAHLLSNLTPEQFFTAPFNRQPIGNGPYQLVEWRPQQTLILRRNPQYYDAPRPYIETVIFKIIPDHVLLAREVLSGELDLAENLLPNDFKRLQQLWDRGRSTVKPLTYLGRQYDFIAWNLIDRTSWQKWMRNHPPQKIPQLTPHRLFGSRKVRQALTMAIDRQRLAQIVNGELYRPMHGPIPLIMWAYDSTANHFWEYNPSQARKLLNEEGWEDSDHDGILDKNGVQFQFDMLTNSGNVRRLHALTLIQEQLRAVGVAMQPRIIEPQTLIQKYIIPRQFDALLFGWNVSLKMELTGLFHSSTFWHPFHFTGYQSPLFDEWEQQALAADNHRTAQQYWNKIARLLSEDLPYTWLYYQVTAIAIHQRYRGVSCDTRGIFHNLPYWWIPVSARLPRDTYFSSKP